MSLRLPSSTAVEIDWCGRVLCLPCNRDAMPNTHDSHEPLRRPRAGLGIVATDLVQVLLDRLGRQKR